SRIWIFKAKADRLPAVHGAASLVRDNRPKWDAKGGTIDLFYWYWGTHALYQMGRDYWKVWNPAVKSALLPAQKTEGCETGSWDPVGAWGTAGGRVYATAINVLTLEVYYRYGRLLSVD
ncbi:MAG: hypothetical protein ACYTHM_17455, partial [Planctomycetota bacterium]